MANYAEEITSWYLRLNGFFLLENFVIHRRADEIEHRSDADILALRLPCVEETIGAGKRATSHQKRTVNRISRGGWWSTLSIGTVVFPGLKVGRAPMVVKEQFSFCHSRIYANTWFQDFGQVTEKGRGLVGVDRLVLEAVEKAI